MSENADPLAALDRDLRFIPSRCESPKRLTPEQIEFYNENGYLKGFRIFGDEAADANRAYFDRLLEKALEAGQDSYSINGWHHRCQGIYDIVKNPVILDYVEDLLGPNFVAWGTHYFCKLPGDGKSVSYHQDASYWPLTPTKTVTVWLAIDDADRENGCMRVLPGTHRLGHLEFRRSDASENNVLNQTLVDADRFGEPVYFELKAGEISLHSDMLAHGSEPNVSERRRCGLTARYAAADVRALMGWNRSSILCRGEDRSGHWGNLPRPERDFPES
jgi:ectoine hydroxylase-related dioxygenase (phytanoyl-CoA dioxygenase family)